MPVPRKQYCLAATFVWPSIWNEGCIWRSEKARNSLERGRKRAEGGLPGKPHTSTSAFYTLSNNLAIQPPILLITPSAQRYSPRWGIRGVGVGFYSTGRSQAYRWNVESRARRWWIHSGFQGVAEDLSQANFVGWKMGQRAGYLER